MYNILICDDEKDIVNALEIYLSGTDHHIVKAYNGREAVDIVKKQEIHLVIMDIMMPVMDGITAMEELRRFSNVPIILLTAKSEDVDKIRGLISGADDYVTKPFNPIELQARVRSQLRRYMQLGGGAVQQDLLKLGGIEMDTRRQEVRLDGNLVAMTHTEYDILKLFLENIGKVLSPKEIYEKVWQENPIGSENTVAVHIRHVREKIEYDPSNPRYLKVVWGRGYIMSDK